MYRPIILLQRFCKIFFFFFFFFFFSSFSLYRVKPTKSKRNKKVITWLFQYKVGDQEKNHPHHLQFIILETKEREIVPALISSVFDSWAAVLLYFSLPTLSLSYLLNPNGKKNSKIESGYWYVCAKATAAIGYPRSLFGCCPHW